jgi:hypothetical protein
MSLLDWFTKKPKETKCNHEYFVAVNSHSSKEVIDKAGVMDYNFMLSCIHCGYGFEHDVRITNCINSSVGFKYLQERYNKTVLTRLYGRFPIINKLTKIGPY